MLDSGRSGLSIIVIGTGYVGLVTGACFAELGLNVTCVDSDKKKIAGLKQGKLPIYESGLERLVLENVKSSRLQFSGSLEDAVGKTNSHSRTVFFIAVGTPPSEAGSAELKYVLAVAGEIGRYMKAYSVIVDKSTVPVGTAEKVRAAIESELKKRNTAIEFDVVSNPEFLKEGAAIADFMKPDRVVVGLDSDRAKAVMDEIYAPLTRNHHNITYMGLREAEMTKYVANAMLATKISFMNEIASLCEDMNVDVESVRVGIGSDSRIGFHFIYPGCGYGGSCFPKDVKALIEMAREHNFNADLLKAVESRNEDQKKVLVRKISDRFGNKLKGRHFGIWGLSFKPGTDDVREAPSLVLIRDLVEAGATVTCYDPVAMKQAKHALSEMMQSLGGVRFAEDQYSALKSADALVLVTEWKPFQQPDFDRIGSELKEKIIFDGRNQYDPGHVVDLGFEYYGIGRNAK